MSKKDSKCSSEKEDIYKLICPYNKIHKLTETQYERHLQKCENRPKTKKKINDDENKNDNNDNNNINNENENNNEFLDDEKISESYNDNPNLSPVIKVKNFNFDYKDDGNVFGEEDFVFKQCYI